MTVIDVSAAVTALGGRSAVQDGYLLVEYLRGADGHPSARMDGDTVLLPQTIRVSIVDGEPTEPVNVPPTDGECYARITIESVKPYAPTPLILSAVAVPPGGPVDISDLVAVDPSTYEPTTTVVTAWQAAIAQVNEATAIAGTFADRAEDAAGEAGTSAFSAGTSAATALGHANDTKNRSDAAAGSASAASGSAGAAAGSAGAAAQSVTAAAAEREGARLEKVAAQAARTGAEDARTGAETAKLGAETAQTGAQTARTGAETARTGAESARTGAEQARDVALSGQVLGSLMPAGTDLNALGNPGYYRFNSGSGNTVALGFPFDSFIGVVEVVARQNTRATQIALTTNGVNESDSRRFYMRTQFNSGWSAWKVYTSALVNSPTTEPGLEYSMWDYVNSRHQPLSPTFVSLSTADLNTVTLPGTYHQGNSASAQLARNYPVAERGILEVSHAAPNGAGFGSNTSFVMHRYTLLAGNSRMRGFYERRGFLDSATTGTWAFEPWSFIPSQRIVNPTDQPGVELRTWDDINIREQRVAITDVALGAVDLNLVLLDGTYRQSDSGSATLARNYPAASAIGALRVSNTGNTVLQEYVPTASAGAARGIFIRRYIYSAGTWTAWAFVASQRVDQTAGRVIYTWDDVNGREQLIYGDTGWRDISTLLLNGWTGSLLIRRVGMAIEWRGSLDGTAATSSQLLTGVPAGFRIGSNLRFVLASQSGTSAILDQANNNLVLPTGVVHGTGARLVSWSYFTPESWPSALPGSASGSVPA